MGSFHLINYNDMSAAALCEFVQNKHNKKIRQSMQLIGMHLDKWMESYLKQNPLSEGLKDKIMALFDLVDTHLRKEETVLFPFVAKMDAKLKGFDMENFPKQSIIANPIKMMQEEHNKITDRISEIRSITNNYTVSDCNEGDCILCMTEMFDLEQEMMKQIFVEQTILFPKILRLDEQLRRINTPVIS